jgi:hypothetical protein
MRSGHVRLRPGLIDEDEASRVYLRLMPFPPGAAACDVGAVLLCCEDDFFKANPLAAQKPSKRVAGGHDISFSQLSQKSVQRQNRILGKPGQQPIAFALEQERAPATDPPGHRISCRTGPLRSASSTWRRSSG